MVEILALDDSETLKMKIEYANRMGLAGLMIWAIDLDNNNLDALRAILDPSVLDSLQPAFAFGRPSAPFSNRVSPFG